LLEATFRECFSMTLLPSSRTSSSRIPGPRTHPTVNSLAQTNQRSLRSWQISLGALHVSLLLGGILGSLACAFYLGFFSGQKIGIEMALSNNLSSAMRLPLGNDDEAPLGADEGLTDVYAKLNQLDAPAEPMLPKADGSFGALDADTAKAKPSIGSIGNGAGSRDTMITDLSNSGSAHEDADPSFGALAKALHDKEPTSGSMVAMAAGASAGELGTEPSAASGGIHLQPIEERGTSSGSLAKEKTLGALAEGAGSQDASALSRSDLSRSDLSRSAEQAAKERARKETELKEAAAKELAAKQVAAKEAAAKVAAAKELAAKEALAKEAALKKSEAEKQKASASSAGSGLVRDTLPRGWFAQVAAPDNRAEAEGLARKLQKSGFQVMIENAKVRGQEYFRVLVGPEETRQQSERLLGQLKREPGLKADPFIRMVR
jgi:cell division septation protein DedD